VREGVRACACVLRCVCGAHVAYASIMWQGLCVLRLYVIRCVRTAHGVVVPTAQLNAHPAAGHSAYVHVVSAAVLHAALKGPEYVYVCGGWVEVL
jgi:hypothetical protein